MFPLILGLFGLAWLVMGGKDALRQPASKEDLTPPSPKSDAAPSTSSGTTGSKEGLFGDAEAPIDLSALFGTSAPGTPAGGWSLSELLGASRSASPTALPERSYVAQSPSPAIAPLMSGERVTFTLERNVDGAKDQVAVLEGIYSGPEDKLSLNTASVAVDRVALSGAEEIAAGRYAIPASKRDYEHSYVSRVAWKPVAPSEAGLKSIAAPPLSVGDKLTLVAEDDFGTRVVWIGMVTGGSAESGYEVSLYSAYKVLRDVGEGKISRPFFSSQATVKLPSTWLVDPKSIP